MNDSAPCQISCSMFEENNDFKPQHFPLFRKGQEIFDVTSKVIELIPEEDEIQGHIKSIMLEDAAMLSVKVAGAEASDLYDLRMENATIIRKAARDLVSHCSSLEVFGFQETHYLQLIREAVEEYRILFIEWVKSFDQCNYVKDRWGLFNPPGINTDDPDPDNDKPHNDE